MEACKEVLLELLADGQKHSSLVLSANIRTAHPNMYSKRTINQALQALFQEGTISRTSLGAGYEVQLRQQNSLMTLQQRRTDLLRELLDLDAEIAAKIGQRTSTYSPWSVGNAL